MFGTEKKISFSFNTQEFKYSGPPSYPCKYAVYALALQNFKPTNISLSLTGLRNEALFYKGV